jgi:tRNA pseudouridine38-40 synthase
VVSFPFTGEVPRDLAARISSLCRPDLAVLAVERAAPGFDARLSAKWRLYRYRLLVRQAPDPLRRHVTWHVPKPLDVAAMHANGASALGDHDFSAFCRVPDGGHAQRRVISLDVELCDDEIHVVVSATSFCQQMVRSLVGTLVAGRSVQAALTSGDRAAAGPVAPPHGLCLEAVGY